MTHGWRSAAFGQVALALVAALVIQLLVGAPAQATESILPEIPDQTYQTNAPVDAIVTIGNVTYLGGEFTSVRPAGSLRGSNEVPRARLAAIDNTTGELLPWNPGANGTVYALAASPDGQTIYAAGTFGVLGKATRKKVGAVSASGTGAVTPFKADADLKVYALAATDTTVYIGGSFTSLNGTPRSRLAAVDTTGAVLPGWAPAADDNVRAIAIAPDGQSVYAVGEFRSINGATRERYLTKLDPTTGVPQAWSSRPGYPIWSVAVTSTNVFIGGNGAGGHASGYTTQGALQWKFQTDGGVQAVYLLDGVLYVGGHFDNVCVGDTDGPTTGFKCPPGQVGVTRHKLVAIVPEPDPSTGLAYRVDPWNPGANSDLGVFALTGAGSKLQVGGPFTTIGLRFAKQEGYAQFTPLPPNTPPTASFTVKCMGLQCAVDGRGSTDPDGSITSWTWSFGDGGTATGATATHQYAAGTFDITLTVTDNRGATSSTTQSVSTENALPTARFTVNCPELTCAVDGSTSSDPDGTIDAYAWDFGDGGTDVGASATHTFGDSGSQTISLTVTDNAGATATSTQTVVLSGQESPVSFIAASAVNLNSSRPTVRVPADVQPGDALLLIVTNNNAATATTPAGWERAGDQLLTADGVNGTSTVWQRVATAGDAGTAVTVALSGTAKVSATVLAYRGTSATDPLATQVSAAETVNRSTHFTPSTSGIPGGGWVVSYWADKSSTTTGWTVPDTEVVRATSIGAEGTSGHISAVVTDSGAPLPAGSRSGLAATADGSSNKAAMWTLVLAP
jgi:PKD repeat protein